MRADRAEQTLTKLLLHSLLSYCSFLPPVPPFGHTVHMHKKQNSQQQQQKLQRGKEISGNVTFFSIKTQFMAHSKSIKRGGKEVEEVEAYKRSCSSNTRHCRKERTRGKHREKRVGKTTTEETEAKAKRCLETRFSRVWPTGWASRKGKGLRRKEEGKLNFNLVPCRTKRNDAQSDREKQANKIKPKTRTRRFNLQFVENSWTEA